MIKEKDTREGRMIHVRLSESVHKRLRIRVAEEDTTIQHWVADLIEQRLQRAKRSIRGT